MIFTQKLSEEINLEAKTLQTALSSINAHVKRKVTPDRHVC
jgi:hypothetical protein